MMDRTDSHLMAGKTEAPMDYVGLADFLTALAYPARLELLDLLRFPQALSDIRLAPRRSGQHGQRGSTTSKQAVHVHLGKLVDADLVRTDRVEQEGRMVQRYEVNPTKLYALIEELRRLSVMQAGRGAAADATGTLGQVTHPDMAKGPRLVLVHGVYEGRGFPLDPRTSRDGQWTIGRRRGLPVSLDYDPFVSLENAFVTEQGGRYTITDIEGSKNGTSVNWSHLPKGQSRVLKAADVIGLGRSLLNFAPE